MKSSKNFSSFLFTLSLLILTSNSYCKVEVEAEKFRTSFSDFHNLQPGAGFSTAMQQVANGICYNATTPQYATRGGLMFSDARTFDQLEASINVDVSTKGGYGLFSGSATAKYMRSIKDTSTTMSVNYAQTIVQNVGYTVYALNQLGTMIYQGQQQNKTGMPNFDIMCGNSYVTDYDRGAMLLASFNIEFATAEEKQTFETSTGFSFGDFAQVAASIQEAASKYGLKGAAVLKAMQIGGDPAQLAKIMGNGANITQCSITDMTACQKTAQDIIEYAANNFSKQVTCSESPKPTSDTCSLLPLNVQSDTQGIANLGKMPLPTVITPEITAARLQLAGELNQAQYYRNNFNTLLAQYPVPWDVTSSFYKTASALNSQAAANIKVILANPNNIENSAEQCYNTPVMCPEIAKAIASEIKPINAGELSFLDSIEYTYRGPWPLLPSGLTYMADFYYDGGKWSYITNIKSMDQITQVSIIDWNDTDATLKFYGKSQGPGGDGQTHWWTFTNGKLQPDGKTISFVANKGEGPFPGKGEKLNSSYYFTIYKLT